METEQYEHYIGLDWAQMNMAAAVLSKGFKKVRYLEDVPNIEKLKKFIKSFSGTKMLVIEETTSTQWLFIALIDCVDKLVVCDPYRNRLMTHGAKTDRIDSLKLAQLGLRGDMNIVYHSTAGIMNLRKLVSAYEDVVRAIVRAKNQMSAVYRGECKSYQKKDALYYEENIFVESKKKKEIEFLEEQKKDYEKKFKVYMKKTSIRNLMTIPGIGLINAVKIACTIIDPRRFKDKSKLFGYCGLAKHIKISGGRSYGKKNTRYSRIMKCVFKTAAMAAINADKNEFKTYYESMVSAGVHEHSARNAVARKIAVIAMAIMKKGQKYIEKQIAA